MNCSIRLFYLCGPILRQPCPLFGTPFLHIAGKKQGITIGRVDEKEVSMLIYLRASILGNMLVFVDEDCRMLPLFLNN